nr:hypothetical protein [uncultured Brevundimonas sp.]
MRITALVTVSAAVLALAACGKGKDEHAAAPKPANDAVEAAGVAEDSVLTTEQSAQAAAAAAEQSAQNAHNLDTAAPPTPAAAAPTEAQTPPPAPAAH